MKHVLNKGSYLKLSACVLSFSILSGDLSAGNVSRAFSEIFNSFGGSVSRLSAKGFYRVKERSKTAWNFSNAVSEAGTGQLTEELETAPSSRARSAARSLSKHSIRMGRSILEGGRIVKRKGNSFLDKAYEKRLKRIDTIDIKDADKQALVINKFLRSNNPKAREKGHTAKQNILNDQNHKYYFDTLIYYYRYQNYLSEASKPNISNLMKHWLTNPSTSLENFKKITGAIRYYNADLSGFIKQFVKDLPEDLPKDDPKRAVLENFLNKQANKDTKFQAFHSALLEANNVSGNTRPTAPPPPYKQMFKKTKRQAPPPPYEQRNFWKDTQVTDL
jgi:hypothetical protein